MAVFVQKYGGTSVGSIDRISRVASRILETIEEGHSLAVVVSAMSGETARLIDLAKQVDPSPYSREYDLLVASGEQVTVGLLSLAINRLAKEKSIPFRARPFLAHQLGILTDQVYSKARIQMIDRSKIEAAFGEKQIPVIAGFQGVDSEGNITTLGRGGSDTSAVAIAASIQADACDICTDVDGIYTADPRICPEASKLDHVSYEEMMELASLGSKVLQIRSVELASKFHVKLHVRSSFEKKEGTVVSTQESLETKMEKVLVAGVASDAQQTKFTVRNLPNHTQSTASVFKALSDASVVVDVIVQDVNAKGSLNIGFTLHSDDEIKAEGILKDLLKKFPETELGKEQNLAKVSIVGVGMQHHPGVASKMFEVLASKEIEIKLVSTSEIKVSCLIDGSRMADSVQALHSAFELS